MKPNIALLLILILIVGFTPLTWASMQLHCRFHYATMSRIINFKASANPYQQSSVDLFERFRFKSYLQANKNALEQINLYVYYYPNGKTAPILLSETKYKIAHEQITAKHSSLTGEQHIYTPEKQRELIYQCNIIERQS